jgi:hypothetical protein
MTNFNATNADFDELCRIAEIEHNAYYRRLRVLLFVRRLPVSRAAREAGKFAAKAAKAARSKRSPIPQVAA